MLSAIAQFASIHSIIIITHRLVVLNYCKRRLLRRLPAESNDSSEVKQNRGNRATKWRNQLIRNAVICFTQNVLSNGLSNIKTVHNVDGASLTLITV
jgi:hypothetical protein